LGCFWRLKARYGILCLSHDLDCRSVPHHYPHHYCSGLHSSNHILAARENGNCNRLGSSISLPGICSIHANWPPTVGWTTWAVGSATCTGENCVNIVALAPLVPIAPDIRQVSPATNTSHSASSSFTPSPACSFLLPSVSSRHHCVSFTAKKTSGRLLRCICSLLVHTFLLCCNPVQDCVSTQYQECRSRYQFECAFCYFAHLSRRSSDAWQVVHRQWQSYGGFTFAFKVHAPRITTLVTP